MKRISILGLILFAAAQNYYSQTKVWLGTTSSEFTVGANWQGGSAPGGGEDLLFDSNGGSNDCDLSNTSLVANSFSVMSGYTGNINFGGNQAIINGNLVINSGSVLAATNIDFAGTGSPIFSLGGTGIFNGTGGSISVDIQQSQSFAFSGNITIDLLIISGGAGTPKRDIDFGSNLIVNDVVLSTGGTLVTSKIHSFQGTIHVKNSLDVSASNYTTVPSGNTANFIFDGAAASIVASASSTANLRVPLPNIEINTTGNFDMTGQLNIRGNWTGTQGTLTQGTSTVNMYGSSASILGSAAAFDNLTIQSGATIAMPANQEVKIGKTLTRTGTLNFQTTSILGLDGSASQTISGAGFTLGGIHAYNGSRTITLSTPVVILDFLQVDANVTFASGSNLTLRSTNALTSRVGQLGSGASITGSPTVETLIPGNLTGWANLGIRGVTSQNIKSWDTYSASSGANGIPMTCDGCDYGIGSINPNFYSIQGWNESIDDYDTTLVAADPLTPGKGFWVYVGDNSPNTSDLTLINTGSLVTGPVTVPVTNAGAGVDLGGGEIVHYNLVANPYPSPISCTNLFTGGNAFDFTGVVYVYNADIGYTSYNTTLAVSSPGGSGSMTDVIPSGQGFYVEYNHNPFGNSLDFDESMKVSSNTSANPLLRPATNSTVPLFRLKLQGSNDWDATVFCLHPNALATHDRYDAHKILQSPGYQGYPGPYSKYTTISSKDGVDKDYSINTMPPLTQSLSIPILARVSSSGTYTISAYDFQNFPNVCVGLKDKLDNSYHDLKQGDYSVTIADTTSVPRFELLLCKDLSINPVGISENTNSGSILINQDQQGPYVLTSFDRSTKATISAFNIMGQKLMNDVVVEGISTNTRLNFDSHNQVVFIKVTTDSESTTKKIITH
jgi:hypothetical protein